MFGIKTPIIREGDDIVQILETSLENAGVVPIDGDILVLAESAVGTAEMRVIELASVIPGEKALLLGNKYGIDAREMELVLQECDEIFGGVPGAALTITKGVLPPNAGIDSSNRIRPSVRSDSRRWPFAAQPPMMVKRLLVMSIRG